MEEVRRAPLTVMRAIPRTLGLVTAGFALVLDQVSKQVVLANLRPGIPSPIAPFFAFRLGFNEGVSFGMFADWFSGRPMALAAIAMGIVAVVLICLWRTSTLAQAVALGSILGGALSNIFDRLRIGAVVDYLDFHVGGYHWPTFNLADTAIVCGVALLLVSDLLDRSGAQAKHAERKAE